MTLAHGLPYIEAPRSTEGLVHTCGKACPGPKRVSDPSPHTLAWIRAIIRHGPSVGRRDAEIK